MALLKLLLVLLVIIATFFKVLDLTIKASEEKRKKEIEDDYGYSRSSYDSNSGKKKLLAFKPVVYIIYCVFALVVTLFSSIFFTNEQNIGFVSTFGKTTIIDGSGLHFKVPFISEKHIFDSTIQGMSIGYDEETNESVEEDSLMITSDFNFVNIDFYIEYRITDPIEYYYGSDNPEGILRNIAQASIRNIVGQYEVDPVMTTGKSEIQAKVFEDVIQELATHHTGLSVTNITLQDSEPPTEAVATAFKNVEDAKQNAETTINRAYEYKNTQLPAAEAKAEAIIQSATAEKTERVNQAKAEIAEFEALYNEYINNPGTVKQRLYYEALEEILPNLEIIIGKDSKVIYVKDSLADSYSESKAAVTDNYSGTESTNN